MGRTLETGGRERQGSSQQEEDSQHPNVLQWLQEEDQLRLLPNADEVCRRADDDICDLFGMRQAVEVLTYKSDEEYKQMDIRETLREWIGIDDQIRGLQAQIKALRDQKTQLGFQVMDFMKGQNLDQFVLEGGGGTIARQQRTVRARPNKQVVRTQVALLLADQPQRMAEVLRTIEGLPEPGQEPDAGSVVVKELLTRRLPRSQNIHLG